MKDREGAGWQLGLAGVGWGLFAAAPPALNEHEPINVMLGVTGLFLLGANFTINIARSITYDKPVPQNTKIDSYFAPKYQFPVGTPVSWGGVNIESGMVWGNGAFVGLDFNFGGEADFHDFFAGSGLCLGNVYDFGNQLYFVYGGAAGFW
jgi:hypothetical protein